MKICIYGAGAIGGHLGVCLKEGGADVSLVARGAHLEAIRSNGLKLLIDGRERVAKMTATADPTELGHQDYVIIALKAHQAWDVAEQMRPLLGPNTAVVTAQNGVPWWYFYGFEGQYANLQLQSIDPEGRQWRTIGPERAIGCTVYPAAEIAAPGVVKHIYGDRFGGAASVGAHRTSMLQDLDKGRPIELDALLTVVQEMGRIVDVETPAIDIVLALAQQMGRVRGVYPVFPEAVAPIGPEAVGMV
jgi:ketopantoate reductase